jgi:hypothetical protein
VAYTLSYLGDETIHLRDRSYRWIDVKHFRLGGEQVDERAYLGALLSHPEYRDHYTSPDSVTDVPIHGPYRLSEIEPSSFEERDEASVSETLNEWLERYGPVAPSEIEGNLQSVFDLLKTATSRFLLRDLGATAQHDFGWVLSDFCEFVIVDSNSEELALVVAAGD